MAFVIPDERRAFFFYSDDDRRYPYMDRAPPHALEFVGEQNHASTSPMNVRKDAGIAALRLGAAIDAAFSRAAGERPVWTFGEASFEPGSHSITPRFAYSSVTKPQRYLTGSMPS